MSTRDELAGVLADTLNKQFKDMKVAYFFDGTDTTPTDIKDFISTGSTMLDLAISNNPDGGIAVGRITEINGLESQVVNHYLDLICLLRLKRKVVLQFIWIQKQQLVQNFYHQSVLM